MNGLVARTLVVLLALATAGCSGDATPSARAAARAVLPEPEEAANGLPAIGDVSYRPVALSAVAAISGSITLEGAAPTATTSIPDDPKICGTRVPPVVEPNAKGLSNTLVWISDAKTGKPLPVEKRLTIVSEECVLEPRVVGTVVGAAVNVFNDDRLLHRLVFTRGGAPDTLTVMRFFNDGQVVPSERLTKKPGVVEIRCVQHPWTRGFIAVFDHPYFAVTERDGKFQIDSLPPGSYTVKVWHDGASKTVERTVTIAAGGTATVDVAVALAARD